jgi:hypothetical protein
MKYEVGNTKFEDEYRYEVKKIGIFHTSYFLPLTSVT